MTDLPKVSDEYVIKVNSWMDQGSVTLNREQYLERWEVCTINDVFSISFSSDLEAEREELQELHSKFENLKSQVLFKHFNNRAKSSRTGEPHPLADLGYTA
jgi:hypothetical protein